MRKRHERTKQTSMVIFAACICIMTFVITVGMAREPIQAEEQEGRYTVIYQAERTGAKSDPLNGCSFDAEDSEILERIAMAEAEGEGVEGKALVMLVVLNRVQSGTFPDSIHDVVFQKNQFAPIKNGRYYSVTPDEECEEAEEMILDGWDESQGALYFASNRFRNAWHDEHLDHLFTVGHHDFYK